MNLSKHAVPFFGVELRKTEAQGSFMIRFGFLDQFAAELRVAAVFGPQAFPSTPRCLCPQDLSIIAALLTFVLGDREVKALP